MVPANYVEINLPMDFSMNIYPANEHRIWEVERGRSFSAILPLNEGKPLSAGDCILFALSISHGNQEPAFVKGGDSVRVVLTDVTDLEKTDPVTGEALIQITWEPTPGQDGRDHHDHKPGRQVALASFVYQRLGPAPPGRSAGVVLSPAPRPPVLGECLDP